jgi:hypothetical protein
MLLVNLLTALAIGYAAAVPFFFTRGLKAGPRGAIFVLLAVIVLGSGLVLGPQNMAARSIVTALVLIIFLLHMWDLHMDPDRKSRLSL